MSGGFETVRVDMPQNPFFTHVLECRGHDEGHGALFDFHWERHNYGTDPWLVASASGDHSIRVFTLPNGKHIRTLFKQGGHVEWVTFVAILRSGDILSAGLDGRVISWAKGGAKGTEQVQMGSIANGFFDRETQESVFGGSHATVCLMHQTRLVWQTSVLPKMKAAPNLMTCCIFGGKYVGIGARDGGIFVLDKSNGDILWKKKAFTQSVIACYPFGSMCVFGGADGQTIFVNPGGSTDAAAVASSCSDYLAFPSNNCGGVTAFTADDDLLFVGHSDGTLAIYENYEGDISKLNHVTITDKVPIMSIAHRFVEKTFLIYCGHSDGTLTIWNNELEEVVLRVPVCRGGINKIGINEEAKVTVVGGDDAILRVLGMKK